MWSNLEGWQKSGVVLAAFYVLLYTLGRIVVPVDALDHIENYKWPPLMYSACVVLPILLMKYSRRRMVKIHAGVILVLFMLITLVPVTLNLHEFYRNSFNSSGNAIAAVFSVLYVAPLIGGFISLVWICSIVI